jgi:hypothetical protein
MPQETFELHSIPVVVENTRPDIRTADVVERLTEALDLVARYQPWRLRHLQRDLELFLVVRFPCRPLCQHE